MSTRVATPRRISSVNTTTPKDEAKLLVASVQQARGELRDPVEEDQAEAGERQEATSPGS